MFNPFAVDSHEKYALLLPCWNGSEIFLPVRVRSALRPYVPSACRASGVPLLGSLSTGLSPLE
jgi:hypothetical protein